jgi:3-dehydroquinate synthetase
LFQLLEEKVEQVFQMDAQILTEIIKRTASIKDEVVSIDEREDGLRCILNYGHTIGKTVMQLIPTQIRYAY